MKDWPTMQDWPSGEEPVITVSKKYVWACIDGRLKIRGELFSNSEKLKYQDVQPVLDEPPTPTTSGGLATVLAPAAHVCVNPKDANLIAAVGRGAVYAQNLSLQGHTRVASGLPTTERPLIAWTTSGSILLVAHQTSITAYKLVELARVCASEENRKPRKEAKLEWAQKCKDMGVGSQLTSPHSFSAALETIGGELQQLLPVPERQTDMLLVYARHVERWEADGPMHIKTSSEDVQITSDIGAACYLPPAAATGGEPQLTLLIASRDGIVYSLDGVSLETSSPSIKLRHPEGAQLCSMCAFKQATGGVTLGVGFSDGAIHTYNYPSV